MIIAATAVLTVGIILARRDIELKRYARAAIADLCANAGSLEKLSVESAADRIEAAAKGTLFFNSSLERQAAAMARGHVFSLNLQQGSINIAREFELEADSDYSRKARRERVDAEKAKLAGIRADFGERMRALVAAHK
jgi:hypothetical protein